MRKLWMILVISLALAGGYWMGSAHRFGGKGTPVGSPTDLTALKRLLLEPQVSVDQGDGVKKNEEKPLGSLVQGPGASGGSAEHERLGRVPGEEGAVYDLADPKDRIVLENALREEGLSEKEIRKIVGSEEDQSENNSLPAEALTYDLGSASERELLRASLEAEGVPSEDIQKILGQPLDGLGGTTVSGQNAVSQEAKVYDLNSESDRAALLAALRAEKLPEEDIQKIMAPSATEGSLVPPPSTGVEEGGTGTEKNP